MTDPRPRRYRAPVEDGAALIDPPLSQVPTLIASNRAKLKKFDESAVLPAGFRASARRSLVTAAVQAEQGNSAAFSTDRPMILAGHQPELFHPGVWLKNFLLSSISQSVGGYGVNLIANGDTIRSASIRVPVARGHMPEVVDIPFDAASNAIPWEERRILDEQVFRTFAIRVQDARCAPFSGAQRRQGIVLDRLWPHAIDAAKRSRERACALFEEVCLRAGLPRRAMPAELEMSNLGQCLAEARHCSEREYGLTTNEVPVSWLGYQEAYLAFSEYLLIRHLDFQAIHNAVLVEYRAVNSVRSHAHPVPQLIRDDEWVEVPFWIWTSGNNQRRRAFVRQVGASWELTDRAGLVISPSDARWSEMWAHGIRFRPRALVTTMYARLVLSDLFIHGIGGAKYDELTDEIIRRFFGIEPPAYLTATATFRLPIDRPQVTIEDVRECVRRIRDLRYRPESFVADPLLAHESQIAQQLQSLAAEKRQYVRTHVLRRGSEAVFAGVDRINRTMHELLRPVEEHLRREHARLVADARRARVLGSREFSFVLFPEDYLVPRLLELARVPA
jgi:hypothetical protein